jgi:hypothetical protein
MDIELDMDEISRRDGVLKAVLPLSFLRFMKIPAGRPVLYSRLNSARENNLFKEIYH